MSPGPRYDRQLLLLGSKRNALLELWEVQRYGSDSYSDPDYVSLYGLRPAEWYAKGIRLLGRTAVECTRDDLADRIGRDIAAIVKGQPAPLVVDPFAGSGNTLYWIVRHLPGARGVGFELDAAVFELSSRNLAILQLPVRILQADYRGGPADLMPSGTQPVIAFVAPPWGNALSRDFGLDLRRTTPPVAEIVDVLAGKFGDAPLLCAIQVYERLDPDSLAELKQRFQWSALRIYRLNAAGQNHGILLGTRGWTPPTGVA